MTKKKDEEKKLEHTRGGSTTKDATDLGAPMAPVEGDPARYSHQGPEDAMGSEPTRGDYSGRKGSGGLAPRYEMVVVGHRPDGTPIIEQRRQD